MGELALKGVSAAPGVVAGSAVVVSGFDSSRAEVIPPPQRTAELQRAHAALAAEMQSLEHIAADLHTREWHHDAEIVEAGILMARDPGLTQRVETLVMRQGRSAPAALTAAAEEFADLIGQVDDVTLALRADDVRSLGRRAAAHAAGAELTPGGVLIATNLGPADVADLGLAANGAALAEGGVTAHAAIVARSLGVPMVVGLGPEVLDIENGEELVLDGDQGFVVRRPDRARVEAAHADGERRRQAREEARVRRHEPATTTDGHRVTVLTNAATVAEAIEGLEQGAEGIGLLRTELPFLDATAWPSLKQQTEFLTPVLERLTGRPATVRLFDFGGDKTPPFLRGIKGRGIELLLDEPDVLRTHIAAVIKAGRGTDLRILVPMITTAGQMRLVREAVGSAALTGAMIETPGAVAAAAAIAAESDFLSIGTNDLTQLVLGLDREQSRTAPVTDIRVLRHIATTVRAARAAGIPVDVCGEAASDPSAMPVLVGLGVDELSVAAARVGQVRQWVRELDYAAAEKKVAKLLHEARDARRERA
jgi:phosphoenolpyruvate-protein kinase (PTS system EI component)